LRVTKPVVGPYARLELAPLPELEATVEGDRLLGWLGQGLHHIHQLAHEVIVTAIIVAKQNGKPRLAFDKRGNVHIALGALKNHQIAFPVAKGLAGVHVLWTLMVGPIWRKYLTSWASGIPAPSLLAATWKVSGKFFRLSLGAVNMGVDRFMADTNGMSFECKPTGNLFGGPAFF
jgi:hypothetical protein